MDGIRFFILFVACAASGASKQILTTICLQIENKYLGFLLGSQPKGCWYPKNT